MKYTITDYVGYTVVSVYRQDRCGHRWLTETYDALRPRDEARIVRALRRRGIKPLYH